MKSSNHTRIVILILLVLALISVVFWNFSSLFVKDNFAGVFKTHGMRASPETPYNINPVELKKSQNGYFVLLRGIKGTTGDHVYYDLDVTLETNDYDIAKMMVDHPAKTVTVIREVMANSLNDDLSLQRRDVLKSKIIQNLSRVYYSNNGGIESAYFEKFLYK